MRPFRRAQTRTQWGYIIDTLKDPGQTSGTAPGRRYAVPAHPDHCDTIHYMTTATAPLLVARGVWRITTPMPYRPRSVHAYLVEHSPRSWFLLDGGIDSDEAWSHLDAGVRAVVGDWGGVDLHLVSHMHLDHIGLSARVRDACGAPLAMGELDAQRAAHAAAEPAEEALYRESLLRSCGAPGEFALGFTAAAPPPPRPFTHAEIELVSSSNVIPVVPTWISIWTPGHTAGHTSLMRTEDRVLLAADAILPRVTPTIGVNRQREDPVADYLATLDRIEALEPEVAFCGHGGELVQPAERVRELRAATLMESRRVYRALGAEPRSTWQLVEYLYAGRDLPRGPRFLALRETLAHLAHLCGEERALRSTVGGVQLFSSV
ncbi:MBL fold metallo-hydrolase [soil metagenome]